MGGTRSPELLQVAKEIWDYLLANGIAVTAEYLPSSLNIQADWQSRNHRDSSDWKLNPKIFFSDCENQRNTSNRPIFFPTEPSVTEIHVLASGPRQLCSRFPSALLEKPLRLCIPSILLNRKGTCQNKEGPISSSYRNTCMANSVVVRSITRNVGATSHNSTQSDHTVTRSSWAKAPFAGRQPTTVGGMEGFRKASEGEGISKLAATLITNSRRSGSISNYQSAWRKWAS